MYLNRDPRLLSGPTISGFPLSMFAGTQALVFTPCRHSKSSPNLSGFELLLH